ncbi:hypothetical protein D3C76_1516970 [compost metagenome]
MAQGQVAVFVPERILADVFADHHLLAKRRGAAGAGQWPYDQAVERLVIGIRQTGCSTQKQVFLFPVHLQY